MTSRSEIEKRGKQAYGDESRVKVSGTDISRARKAGAGKEGAKGEDIEKSIRRGATAVAAGRGPGSYTASQLEKKAKKEKEDPKSKKKSLELPKKESLELPNFNDYCKNLHEDMGMGQDSFMGRQYVDKIVDIINNTSNLSLVVKMFAPIYSAVIQKDPSILSRLRGADINVQKNLAQQVRNTPEGEFPASFGAGPGMR